MSEVIALLPQGEYQSVGFGLHCNSENLYVEVSCFTDDNPDLQRLVCANFALTEYEKTIAELERSGYKKIWECNWFNQPSTAWVKHFH